MNKSTIIFYNVSSLNKVHTCLTLQKIFITTKTKYASPATTVSLPTLKTQYGCNPPLQM